MEVLNNIWIAISTPNEGLVNILIIPLFLLENYLTLFLFTSILNIYSNKKNKLTYILIMSIISIINLFFIPNPFNIFVNYTVMFFIIKFIFKINNLKNLLGIVLSALIFALIGILILNPYITILDITSDEVLYTPIYKIGYLLLTYILLFIVSFIIKYRKLNLEILEDLDNKNKYIIIANLAFGLVTLLIQAIITFYYTDKLPVIITFLSFLSLLAYFCISIYSFTRIMKLTLTTRKLQSAEEYNNTLRILHDNVRGFKHDFDNIVTTIGGFIRTDDMEGLKKYYLQLEDDCQRVNNLYILNPEVVNNDGIYNLLTKKYYEADSKDIKVNITFLLDLSKLNMKIYEFARILGILLDNAIEASSECEEKLINLTFREDSRNSRQLIIVENTYKNKDVDTEKIFEKGVSGKEEHSGLGLWEVRKIVKKNKNINLFTTKNEKFFIQQLEIYY